MKAYLWISEAK